MKFDITPPQRAIFRLVQWFFDMYSSPTPAVATFQEKPLPEGAILAGWSALVHRLAIQAPVRQPTCVAQRHVRGSRRRQEPWIIFDRRYWRGDSLADHLTFALRHEPIDLLVLKRVFDAAPKAEIEAMIRAAPTGIPARRAWFLYEALTGRTLDVDDAPRAQAIDLLDPEAYFTAKPHLSTRHRIRDNLLGDRRFCPVIRRTKALTDFLDRDLAATARETVGRASAHLVARAASFMLLADSRASFEIEGESPSIRSTSGLGICPRNWRA